MICVTAAVPIHKPCTMQSLQPFYPTWYGDCFYNKPYEWRFYETDATSFFSYYAVDFQGHWYVVFQKDVHDLTALKYMRQTKQLAYMNAEQYLPLVKALQNEQLTSSYDDFDKAFAFPCLYVPSLQTCPTLTQARLACIDGEDDPQVIDHIHYVEHTYKDKTTRFIPGVETHSFGVVTESEYYMEHLYKPTTSHLFLLTFVLHHRYNVIASHQMIPRLLCNLFASTKICNTNYNKALFAVLSITK